MTIVEFERNRFYDRLIWLFPLAFVFHIAEESNGFAFWVTNVLQGRMDVRAFYVNNAVFMLILLGLCFLAMKTRATWSLFLLFLWVGAQEFWNAIFHVFSQFQFRAYSPGYFTAVLLYIPIYYYLSYVCLREGFLKWHVWLISAVASIAGMAFVIWAGLYHFGAIPWEKWLP